MENEVSHGTCKLVTLSLWDLIRAAFLAAGEIIVREGMCLNNIGFFFLVMNTAVAHFHPEIILKTQSRYASG